MGCEDLWVDADCTEDYFLNNYVRQVCLHRKHPKGWCPDKLLKTTSFSELKKNQNDIAQGVVVSLLQKHQVAQNPTKLSCSVYHKNNWFAKAKPSKSNSTKSVNLEIPLSNANTCCISYNTIHTSFLVERGMFEAVKDPFSVIKLRILSNL